MERVLKSIVQNGVIEAIFQRGWVEQSPNEFISAARKEISPFLKDADILVSSEKLNSMILKELTKQLGKEYDINIYRLKFFPNEMPQEYDV